MRLLALLGVVTVFAGILASCTNNRRPPANTECSSNSDCSDGQPYCTPGARTCVECYRDDHCGCHQVCDSNVCAPLGATSPSQRYNAHGDWQGTPGSDNYSYVKTCVSNNDCNFGEICNPLTGGCIPAAEFQVSCASGNACPPGPNGELLICEPDSKRCRPTGLCTTNNNCCGGESFLCEPVAGACMPQQTTCTPPDEVISLQPFEPKVTAGCSDGRFCSLLGSCVQCLSTDDCGSGLRCYAPTNACVSADFCTHAGECPAPDQSCDTAASVCAPRCQSDDNCVEVQYCNNDAVCRPRSELPCAFDQYDNIFSDTLGNETRQQALNNNVTLPVPEEVGVEVLVDGLSLCTGDIDWYVQELERGDLITIHGRSLDSLSASLTAFGPDGTERIGEGFIADVGPYPLTFVANFSGTYFVRVESFNTSTGTYSLRITKGVGEVCEDPFEELHGTNFTPETATLLNDQALVPAGLPVPEGCELSGTVNGSHSIACIDEALSLCIGDIDFFLVRVPAGAQLTTTLSAFAGNLDLRVFGPFFDDSEVDDDPSLIAGNSSTLQSSETVSLLSRLAASYLIEVKRFFGQDTTYNLVTQISVSPTVCVEDAFDDETPGGPFDHPGYNDIVASQIVGSPTEPIEETLNLCRGDVDRFRLGVDDGGEFANVPANWRVHIDLVVDGSSPSDKITLAAGPTEAADTWGSLTISQPQTSVFIERTDGGPLYLIIRGSVEDADVVDYTLHVTFTAPPECSADAYEPNDAPAFANELAPSPWTAVGDTYAIPDAGTLNACADDDWYRFELPAGTRLLARAFYDPAAEVDLGLGLYGNTVATLETVPGGAAITTGRVDRSQIVGAGMLRVFGGTPGNPVFAQLYNRSGWPLFDYDIEFELIPATCVADMFDGNNTYQNAVFPTLLSEADRQFQSVYIDWLTICASGVANWFGVDAAPEDIVSTRVFYKPTAGDLDLFLHRPQGTGTTVVNSDTDDSAQSGLLHVSYTVGANDPAGPYYSRLQSFGSAASFSGTGSYYGIELRVRRACVDDDWAANPGVAFAIPSLPVDEELMLCRDDDWFSFELEAPLPASITICKESDYEEADLDLYVYHGTQDNLVAVSATKVNLEKITLSGGAVQSGTYFVHIDQDSVFRPLANTAYTLKIGLDTDPCP